MHPPSPTWECTYAHDRRDHRHRCRCCGACLETGDKVLMTKVGAFTKRRYTTWAIHLSCADKPFGTGADTTGASGWTWRDTFEAGGRVMPPSPSTKDLVTLLQTYRAANEAVGGRRDIVDTMWIIATELGQRPVKDRMDAGDDFRGAH